MKNLKTKTILITGGAGFIGSHLCDSFVNKGYSVVCIDNLLTGSKKNIEHLNDDKNFHFIERDVINSISNFQFPISNLDIIYHLASPASPNKKSPYSYLNHPLETLLVNSAGTKNMLDLAKKYNARFVYASTSEVYGDPHVHPQTEDYWGNVNPNGPRSCYDEGKRFGEAITMVYHRKYNLDTRIARIFNTYGPRMLPEDGRVISNFIVQALKKKPITVYGDGEQTRSFCYVSDMIDGLLRIGIKTNIAGKVINLGNPDERKIIELAHLVKKLVKSNANITFQDLPEDDPTKRQPDITKAKRLLNWQPAVKLEESLQKTISYFKKKLK